MIALRQHQDAQCSRGFAAGSCVYIASRVLRKIRVSEVKHLFFNNCN